MPEAPLPWRSHKAWAMDLYGAPIFRVPIDPGWDCPHRRRGESAGCSFCAEDGGRARQLGDADTPREQAERAMAFARERYHAEQFQLYIQAYTATHSRVEALRALVEPLLDAYPFRSLSLGTRPDCLPEDMLDVLEAWRSRCEVWVELGVQSSHNDTLRRINRRHSWERSQEAMQRLRARGLRVCAHLIFGLPGEGPDEMLESVDRVVTAGVDGVKFHNLHILSKAPLGQRWREQPFPVLSESAYLECLMLALRRLPADLPVFRVFTDSDNRERLAPAREFSKGEFITELAQRLRTRGWQQGDRREEGRVEGWKVES